ncbi:MAG: hypothetical protein KGI33_05780 [Thaumarchaeota archaeon]|nr:hypothetical protein [Nitrososphaerota archaeon]
MKKESASLLQDLRSLLNVGIQLGPAEEELVKSTFAKILQSGDTYSVKEIEDWFLQEHRDGKSANFERMVNMAHYQKSKFEASNKFRIISGGEGCSCGCSQ